MKSNDNYNPHMHVSNMPAMRKLKGHRGDVYTVLIFQKWVFSAGYDKTIRVWNLVSGQYIRSMTGHTSIIKSLVAIPHKLAIASASWDTTIKIWNIRSGAILATLEGHTNRVKAVVYHQINPLCSYLISGSDDCTLKLWDIESYSELKTYTSHAQPVLCVAVAEKEHRHMFASGSADYSVQLFMLDATLETNQSFMTLGGHQAPVTAVAFSDRSDCSTLYSCSEDMAILLWDCLTGYVLHQLLGHTGPCQSLAVFNYIRTDQLIPTPIEYLISTSLDGSVRIWNTTQCTEEKKLEFSTGYLFCAAVGEDVTGGNKGSTFIVSGDDGLLHMYPRFEESYLDAITQGGRSGRKNRNDVSDKDATSLPTITRGATKTLAVRLPMKQLLLDDTKNNNNTNNFPDSHILSLSSLQKSNPSTKRSARTSSDSLQLVLSSREEQNSDRSLYSRNNESNPKLFGLSSSDVQSSTSTNNMNDYSQNSEWPKTRNQSRIREPRARRPRYSRNSIDSSGALIKPPSRNKKSTKRVKPLPSLQHGKKEFICVTSQYTEPPDSLNGGGLLSCNSFSGV
jgi:WD40 repeat protein